MTEHLPRNVLQFGLVMNLKVLLEEAVNSAEMCIQIPMGGIVESLNLGTSTGIILVI